MKIRGNKGEPLMIVETPALQCLYHVAWGNSRGVVGVCIAIDEQNKTVILSSPKTKIKWVNPVKWSDLRHTRTNAFKIKEKKRKAN